MSTGAAKRRLASQGPALVLRPSVQANLYGFESNFMEITPVIIVANGLGNPNNNAELELSVTTSVQKFG